MKFLNIRRLILIVIAFLIFVACSSKGNKKDKIPDIETKLAKFLTNDFLQKIGFEHFKSHNFYIFNNKDHFYLLNEKDHLIVKFSSQKKVLNSYQESGQGPGGMVTPRSIFLYDADTLAIFDITKARILLFDTDLNFKREIKVDPSIRKLQKSENGFIAFGDFGEKIFARFDNNLNLVETFLEPDRTLPFKDLFPALLYMGHLLGNDFVVYTSWLYVKKECFADIYDLNSKKKTISLKWKHPQPPTQKDISSGTNMYGSNYISEYKKFFIILNDFSKHLKAVSTYDLYIFKKNGELHSRHKSDCGIIPSNPGIDSRIFFLDDEEGISYLDLNDI